MSDTQIMISSKAKLFFICEPVKISDKLSASKIQLSDSHGESIPTWRNQREKKGHRSQASLKPNIELMYENNPL